MFNTFQVAALVITFIKMKKNVKVTILLYTEMCISQNVLTKYLNLNLSSEINTKIYRSMSIKIFFTPSQKFHRKTSVYQEQSLRMANVITVLNRE